MYIWNILTMGKQWKHIEQNLEGTVQECVFPKSWEIPMASGNPTWCDWEFTIGTWLSQLNKPSFRGECSLPSLIIGDWNMIGNILDSTWKNNRIDSVIDWVIHLFIHWFVWFGCLIHWFDWISMMKDLHFCLSGWIWRRIRSTQRLLNLQGEAWINTLW